MTADIIDIRSKKPSMKDKEEQVINLALLSVFYFTDKFESKVSHLHEEIRYALCIMVYQYLVDAKKHNDLEFTKDGFALATEAANDLERKIDEAVKTKSITLN